MQGNHLVASRRSIAQRIPHVFQLECHKPKQQPLHFLKYTPCLILFFLIPRPPPSLSSPILSNPPEQDDIVWQTSCLIAYDYLTIFTLCRIGCPGAASYRIVPARSGLKAYNQSFMSLSLMAWSRTPRCFVHTPNVFGVWNIKDNVNTDVYKHRSRCTLPRWGRACYGISKVFDFISQSTGTKRGSTTHSFNSWGWTWRAAEMDQ